ncbi:MAG TPA: outer membrane beta-barrel protein [Verrucomicrobiae bacterium]|nr:outer membrane beta-barrel protein [Verrucomicrobiae bacterium]
MQRILRWIVFTSLAWGVFAPYARADFQLTDAIKEFGERRFVDLPPARLKAGPVIVHPSMRNKVEYDSNVFLEDTDGKKDTIFEVLPGVVLDLPVNKHRVTVGYEADMEFFGKGRDRTQNDQNQNFFTLANFHFTNGYVNVLEQLSETSGRAGTTFTSRIPRYDQSIYPKIGYRWKRLIFEEGFRHQVRDFRRQVDDSLDFQFTEWTSVIFYDLFARLKALVEYQLAQIDYDDSPTRQGTFNQFRIGLEGQPLPNLTTKIRIGPQFRNYQTSSKPDFYSWVADMSVEYQVRKNWKVSLDLTRKAVEATFFDIAYYKQHLAGVGIAYRIRPAWEVFTKTRVYRQDYAERATVGSQTGYRHDRYFNIKTGLRYEPRDWMQFELAYELARRHSNFSTFGYTDHIISLSSALLY